MTPTERAAIIIELMRFPMKQYDVSPSGRIFHTVAVRPAPQEQFNAYADVIGELYRKKGEFDVLKSGRTHPFSKKTPKLIRAGKSIEFERGMTFAIRDLGKIEQLLTLKILIFS